MSRSPASSVSKQQGAIQTALANFASLPLPKANHALLGGLDYSQSPGRNKSKQVLTVSVGFEQELAEQIVKLIKDSKLKVQAAFRATLPVTGTKRDLLQEAIARVKNSFPLQYGDFRD